MKKLLIGLAFSLICFSGFAEVDTFNACGGAYVINLMHDIHDNLCQGDYYIQDICDVDEQGVPNTYHVVNSTHGSDSSCSEVSTIG